VCRIGRSDEACTLISDGGDLKITTGVPLTVSVCVIGLSTLRPAWSTHSSGASVVGLPGILPLSVSANDLKPVLVVVWSLSSSTQIETTLRPWLTASRSAATKPAAIAILLPGSVVSCPALLTYSSLSNESPVGVIAGNCVTAVVSVESVAETW
jgi:hypothetical protein